MERHGHVPPGQEHIPLDPTCFDDLISEPPTPPTVRYRTEWTNRAPSRSRSPPARIDLKRRDTVEKKLEQLCAMIPELVAWCGVLQLHKKAMVRPVGNPLECLEVLNQIEALEDKIKGIEKKVKDIKHEILEQVPMYR